MNRNAETQKVSVIIPTYNREKQVCQTIDAVLNQTYRNIEIIVVDDGSDDNTQKILGKYGSKIQYLLQENQGNTVARNTGLKHANGEFVAFCDDDDLWYPDKIETEVKYLNNNKNLAFCFCDADLIDATDEIIGQRVFGEPNEVNFNRLFARNIIWTPSITLVRRESINEVGGFDESLGNNSADYDLWLRIAKKHPFGYIDKKLAQYRFQVNSVGRNREKRLASHLKIFRKNEILDGLSWLTRWIRIAEIYFFIAELYEQDGLYKEAAKNYLYALIRWPFIGYNYWNKRAKKMRFSAPYRILRIYVRMFRLALKPAKKESV